MVKHVKKVKHLDPTVHCLRIAIMRRTRSQNDTLVIKIQFKDPIFTFFYIYFWFDMGLCYCV